MEKPPFWWYLPGKMVIFMGELLVSGRVDHWTYTSWIPIQHDVIFPSQHTHCWKKVVDISKIHRWPNQNLRPSIHLQQTTAFFTQTFWECSDQKKYPGFVPLPPGLHWNQKDVDCGITIYVAVACWFAKNVGVFPAAFQWRKTINSICLDCFESLTILPRIPSKGLSQKDFQMGKVSTFQTPPVTHSTVARCGTHHWSAMKCSDGFRRSAAYKIPQAQLAVLVLLKCCKRMRCEHLCEKIKQQKYRNKRDWKRAGVCIEEWTYEDHVFPDVVSKWLNKHYFDINPQVSTFGAAVPGPIAARHAKC